MLCIQCCEKKTNITNYVNYVSFTTYFNNHSQMNDLIVSETPLEMPQVLLMRIVDFNGAVPITQQLQKFGLSSANKKSLCELLCCLTMQTQSRYFLDTFLLIAKVIAKNLSGIRHWGQQTYDSTTHTPRKHWT